MTDEHGPQKQYAKMYSAMCVDQTYRPVAVSYLNSHI